jgi:glutamate-ammonia-ligase adenylyltransferase
LADEGLLESGAARELIDAALLYQGVTQISRLAVNEDFDPAKAPHALRDLLTRTAEDQDIQEVEARLARTQARVRCIFRAIVGE